MHRTGQPVACDNLVDLEPCGTSAAIARAMKNEQIVVVGGGIVGLATAWTLAQQRPGSAIKMLRSFSKARFTSSLR